jgi:hypothetical protein
LLLLHQAFANALRLDFRIFFDRRVWELAPKRGGFDFGWLHLCQEKLEAVSHKYAILVFLDYLIWCIEIELVLLCRHSGKIIFHVRYIMAKVLFDFGLLKWHMTFMLRD